MAKPDVVVVGGGPAGAALAYFLSQSGLRVTVVEAAPKPGIKPCGWMIPVQVERVLKVPEDLVITSVRGYRVYLDGELIGEEYGRLLAYLVDRPGLVEWLLEQAEKMLKTVARRIEGKRVYTTSGVVEARETTVVATGNVWWKGRGDHILAIQATYGLDVSDPSVAEIWFERDLVGYYWVFPLDKRRAKIGVGGFASYSELLRRIKAFEKRLGARRLTSYEGARIYVGGVDEKALREEPPRIGEAAGFVYPISGEGIRPGIVSAKALADEILKGEPASRSLENTTIWINRQRRLLEAIKAARPEIRAAVLKALDPRDAVDIALGEISSVRLLKLALHSAGKGVSRIFRLLLGRTR